MKFSLNLVSIVYALFFLSGTLLAQKSFEPSPVRLPDNKLAYLRIPLPWNNQALSNQQRKKLVDDLSVTLFPKRDYSSRSWRKFISLLDSPLEITFLEKAERSAFLIPSFSIEGNHRGDLKEVANNLYSIIDSYFQEYVKSQGQKPFPLPKFTLKEEKDQVAYRMTIGVSFLIEVNENRFSLKCSGLLKFDDFKEASFDSDWSEWEKVWETDKDSFIFYLSPSTINKSYGHLIQSGYEKVEKKMRSRLPLNEKDIVFQNLNQYWEKISLWQFFHMNQLVMYHKGSGKDFQLKTEIEWLKHTKGLWSSIKPNPKRQYKVEKGAGFYGSLALPLPSQEELNELFQYLPTIERVKVPAYHRLFKTLGESLSFSWKSGSIGPLIFVDLKSSKAFEKEFKNLMRSYPKIRVMEEPQGKHKMIHLAWRGSQLSFEIREKELVFSPYTHELIDFRTSQLEIKKGPSLVELYYPKKSSTKIDYYHMIDLVSLMVVGQGKPFNPSIFPAFSELGIANQSWEKNAQIQLKADKNRWTLNMDLPSGLLGLLSGHEIQSFDYLKFLTMVYLTGSSI